MMFCEKLLTHRSAIEGAPHGVESASMGPRTIVTVARSFIKTCSDGPAVSLHAVVIKIWRACQLFNFQRAGRKERKKKNEEEERKRKPPTHDRQQCRP